MNTIGAYGSYAADDIAKCKVFYADTLGIEVEEQMGGLRFAIHDQKVFVYPKANYTAAAFTVLNFVVEDIDAAVDELIAKGVSFERYEGLPAEQDEHGVLRGKDAGMGPNIAWFKDPSGNILALTEE